MRLIQAVEIRYFRSIYSLKLDDLTDLTVFAGQNDHGKSNILKALNLFFNSETDWRTPLEFYRDFNMQRLEEVRRDTVKGKQFISVKVVFNRGDRFHNSLPPRFSVTRSWYRDSTRYEQKDDLDSPARARFIRSKEYAHRSLTQFLNNIRYEYIPAIKDTRVFDHVLAELQRALYAAGAGAGLDELLSTVSTVTGEHVRSLQEDFKRATGITTQVALPKTLEGLFKTAIDTNLNSLPQYSISLDLRGDGIRVRYIPSLLHYVATANAKRMYIWGFEEPENSLEYRLAVAMAEAFCTKYCEPTQIFTTSHSPAFISLRSEPQVQLYRVVSPSGRTEAQPIAPDTLLGPSAGDFDLMSDLGLMKFQEDFHARVMQELKSLQEQQEALRALEQTARLQMKPRLLTEGKTDAAILTTAWEKLYQSEAMPFTVESCDVAPGEKGGRGGASILKRYLESVLPNHPWVVLGLFDRDREGVESFSQLRHFREIPGFSNVRAHLNGRAFAILLPVPPGRESFADDRTARLTIEYYFSDEILRNAKNANGQGLIFTPLYEKTVIDNVVVDERPSTDWRWHKISGGKSVFAEEIVPSLAVEAFSHFRDLFTLVLRILSVPSDSISSLKDEDQVASTRETRSPSHQQGKKRSLWPLPGGDYYGCLVKIVQRVEEGHFTKAELSNWLQAEFPTVTKPKLAMDYLSVPRQMGFLDFADGKARLTVEGRHLALKPSPELVFQVASDHILGFSETLAIVQREPGLTVSDVKNRLEVIFGQLWKSTYQVSWRLQWLRSLGRVTYGNRRWYPS
ncbi:MAG: ATP-dependent nuclease [Bacillota bacterium]